MEKKESKIEPLISNTTKALTLIAIRELKNPTNSMLSNYLGFNTSKTSIIVNELRENGMVKVVKEENPYGDLRSKKINITQRGWAQAVVFKASLEMALMDTMDNAIVGILEKLDGLVRRRKEEPKWK